LFTALADPVVVAVSPPTADPGDTILVVGNNFGTGINDVIGVFVDSVPCTSFVKQTSTAIDCVVPRWSAAKDALVEDNPGVLLGLEVQVQTRGG